MVKPLFDLSDLNPRLQYKPPPISTLERTDSQFVTGFTVDKSIIEYTETEEKTQTVDERVEDVQEELSKLHEGDGFHAFMQIIVTLVSVGQFIPWEILPHYYDHTMSVNMVRQKRDELLVDIYDYANCKKPKSAPKIVMYLIVEIYLEAMRTGEWFTVDHFFLSGWFRKNVMDNNGYHYQLKQTLFWEVASWREYMAENKCEVNNSMFILASVKYGVAYANSRK
jgi:hypothetical protein